MSSASSSDSESFSSDESSPHESGEGEERIEIATRYNAYEDEPLASESEEDEQQLDQDGVRREQKDADGLTPTMLASRYERRVTVDEWCKCGCCKDDSLDGSLEFRCCWEVTDAVGKLTFDGSSCVTQHEDYVAITNKTNLLLVSQLLKDKDGRKYCRLPGVSQNEFIRAVGYRWVVRWMCGYLGWDNRRPLSACFYNNLRSRFPTQHRTGYTNNQDRE